MEKIQYFVTSNAKMITISRAEYERFQAQGEWISEPEKQVEILMEAIRLSRQKRFGSLSERTDDDGYEQLSLLFNEAEVYADEKSSSDNVIVSAHKRHKKYEYTLKNIPEDILVEVTEHRLSDKELVCPECGDTMAEIGKEVTQKLKLIPAKVVVLEDWYYTYACRNCEKNGISTPIVKAPKKPAIISVSFATAKTATHIMTKKFVMCSPLYRQEQELKRQGTPLSSQTMSKWILKALKDYLCPVYEQLHKELLRNEVLHADET